MPAQRSDAVRSRARILDAARGADAGSLRLNDVARAAGVGVGTVYRHFPTVQTLLEALTTEALERLRDLAREAAADPGPAAGLGRLIRAALDLQLEVGGLQAVMTSPDVGETTAALRTEIFGLFARILDRAQAAGAARADLTPARVQHLVCGIEHAVQLGTPEDRDVYVDIVLAGLRPAPG
ncbi:helix-turn-helix domain-containing protein [Myceligenerans crystallogenes]|uniref:TetR/AcrR family transcriptional regulator n=1 Tax=Myceligenerans crystallogenes TaxID=316335 RepID=A0ABN2NCI9_9MICO